ncbi:MAG TPA: hypothetical protein VKX25_17425 [Bryobacteraceae bacterium]|jgi:hypothetical protein|nr:hypothetical protein [Bryobacteraceae bacterium]
MLKKLSLAAAVAAASLIASGNTYKVNVLEDTTLNGKQIKAGDYKVALDGTTATLKHGKEVVTVPAHTEQAQSKYQNTAIKYVNNSIEEIHIGGTTTKIVFTPEGSSAAAGGSNLN